MRKIMSVVVLLALASQAACEEDESLQAWAEMKGEVLQASKDFISAFSSEKEYAKWKKGIEERMESRTLETIALDWFYDNESQLRSKDPEAMKKACMFFRLFVETGTPPPLQARSRISRDALMELAQYLRDEAASAPKKK